MSPLAISLIAFGCIFGGMLFGMFLRSILPEHHLSDESKDVLKLGIGIMGTLAALVIGLLLASAKGHFDTISSGLIQTSSKVILLDRLMARYGPETGVARDLLRRRIATAIEQIWPKERIDRTEVKALDPRVGIEALENELLQLSHGTTPSAIFSRGSCRRAAKLPEHAGCSFNRECIAHYQCHSW